MKLKIIVEKFITEVVGLKEGENLIVTVDAQSNMEFIGALTKRAVEAGVTIQKLRLSDIDEDIISVTDVWIDATVPGVYGMSLLDDYLLANVNLRYLRIGDFSTEILHKLYGYIHIDAMKSLTDELQKMVVNASEVRVKTPLGTDIHYVIDPNNLVIKDDGNAKIPGQHIVPAMLNLVPKFGSVSGTLVLEALYANSVYEGVLCQPMTFEIENGIIQSINGDFKIKTNLEDWLRIQGDENSNKCGDNNFGLVPPVQKLCGERFFDERMWGAMNWGFGSVNHWDAPPFGQVSKLHMDGITTNVSVWIDDVAVMENGSFIHKDLIDANGEIMKYAANHASLAFE